MHTDTYTTLCSVLEQKFHVDPARLSPSICLEEIGLDSLSLMEFVFNVEDAFHLRIPEDLLDPRQGGITLQHVCEVIEGLQAGSTTGAGAGT
ncbi:hypothetical protein AcdelDRAFT_3843 [Acidovorax delafieldii 2AN]|uniref:Carrier domain-containing protein n=1 Tax=Acidovorax delafieldii 2AN TaxID=573060 RepID=C5TAB3_ACIDE|nr:phosphopantetheine-binding protein [Acidovorax delafieldii]EER58586.1 hypothetical protein AcdelDRAFT_3843 [Acidovorax delafieldii 2AN]